MNSHKHRFDTAEGFLCDHCLLWINPQDDKIVMGHGDWNEIFHAHCKPKPENK